MFCNTKVIDVVISDVVDVYPMGAGTVVAGATMVARSDGAVSQVPDGAIKQVLVGGKPVFRFTATGTFDGWLVITESYAIPDAVPFV